MTFRAIGIRPRTNRIGYRLQLDLESELGFRMEFPAARARATSSSFATGTNSGRTAVPLYKKEVMPRIGVAYSWDQKTVIRAGYGIFFIPNWLQFNMNPSNDPINYGLDSVGRNHKRRDHSQQHDNGY